VILTTYNSAPSLQRTLDSIREQRGSGDEFALEVIAVDDCSTDDTRRILARNAIPTLTTSANTGGPNRGRNIGLDHVTGEYICFIDHDDTWRPDKIRHQLEAARLHPVVSSAYTVVDARTGRTSIHGVDTGEIKVFSPQETFLKWLAKDRTGQNVYFSTLMISSRLKHIRFEEAFGMVDFDWVLRLLENQSSVEVSRFLMTRYVDGTNLSLNAEYRRRDYDYSLMCLEGYEARYPREATLGVKRLNGSRARFLYLTGEMAAARSYFKKSPWDVKTLLYYFTSFYGGAYVRKHFRVFG
jgi:glycosyltransferase involved in cell wall biosynthesis